MSKGPGKPEHSGPIEDLEREGEVSKRSEVNEPHEGLGRAESTGRGPGEQLRRWTRGEDGKVKRQPNQWGWNYTEYSQSKKHNMGMVVLCYGSIGKSKEE